MTGENLLFNGHLIENNKGLKMDSFRIFLFVLFVYTPSAFAIELTLSSRLSMEYGDPKGITHPNSTLLVYYNSGEVFGHSVIDAKTMYNSEPDLTGHLQCFIKNMFKEACKGVLPKNLKALSYSQAKSLGIGTAFGETLSYTLGSAKVLAIYDNKDELGFAYIFDQGSIHQITSTKSSQKSFFRLIRSLKKR